MEKINEVWFLRIHRPFLKDQPAGWYDVAAYTSPQGAHEALKKLNALGRVVADPKTITAENPNGNSFELKRLDVRS